MINTNRQNAFSHLALVAGLLSCMFIATVCHAQTTSLVAISRATTGIVIDGALTDTAWSKAARVANFGRCDAGKEIAPPDEQTLVYLTYDSTYLYLAMRCFQNTEKIFAKATQRDGRVFSDDSIEFFLLPNSSEYFIFGINSKAVKYDADIIIPSTVHLEWNPNWSVATQVHDTYWDAEIAIPFATIGTSVPANGASIRGNFIRHLQSDGEKLSYGPSNPGFGYASAWSIGTNPTDIYDAASNWGWITFRTSSAVARLDQYGALDSGSLGHTGEIVNNTTSQVTITSLMDAYYGTELHPLYDCFNLGADSSTSNNQMYGCTNYQWRSDSSIYSNDVPILLQSNFKYNPDCLSLKKYFFEGSVEPVLNIQGLRAFNPTTCQFNLWLGSTWVDYAILPISVANSKNLYSHLFNIKNRPVGRYSISCGVYDANNTLLYTKSEWFDKPQNPAWLNCNLGNEEVLLSPWTPMSWNASANTVSCWGRTYQFNNASPVPSSIVTQGQEMLAGPVVINAVINGSPVTWTPSQSISATSTATKATLVTRLTGSNATLTGSTQIEYDGMARIDMNLSGRSVDTLTSLTLEIPLKKEIATLLLADPTDDCFSIYYPYWRGARNGLIPTTTATGPFTPYMWLGNNKLGLIWFAESQKNWSNARWDNAIEIVPQADRVVLRVKFVDAPIGLSAPLSLTFGLQATPVKPLAPEKDFLMYCGYGQEWPCLAKDVPGGGSVTYPAEGNISLQQGAVHIWTTADFDANVIMPGVAPGSPRNDDPFYTIFALEYPNCDMFGIYWDASDAQLKLVIRNGDLVFRNYPLYQTVNYAPWMQGESRLVSVSWSGNTVSVYVMGALAATGTFNPGFINTLEPAALRLGGPFSVDAVKITNNTYSGGGVNATVDANTLFLDHFRQVQGNVTVPEKSYNNTTGTLDGSYLAKNATTMQLNASKESVGWFDLWAGRGRNIAHYHQDWTETEGLPYTNQYANQLTSIVNAANEAGMKFIPYIGFQIGDNSVEYETYKDEIVVESWVEGHGWHRDDPPQVAYDCNYSGQWQNFLVYYIEKMIREKGIGGLYLDGTSIPLPNKNLHSGCGYYDRSGTLRPSYPIFEYRKLFKRIRTIAQQYDPNFWMDIHTTVGIWTPVASFADSYWCGEQFEMLTADTGKSLRELLADDVPLDTYQAWYGHQFGLDGYFLSYSYARDAETISLLHDTPLRVVHDPCLKRAKDGFGVGSAMYYGYYENGAYVSSSDPNVKVSFYQRVDGDILFVMANLGTATVTPTVTILSQLGDMQGADVRDAVTMEKITHTDFTLSVPLEPWRVRLVVVKNSNATGENVSLSDAKKKALGSLVSLTGSITAVFNGAIYVEASDRTVGIRVDKAAHGFTSNDVGKVVAVTGSVAKDSNTHEIYIDASTIVPAGTTSSIKPLGLTNRAAGGGSFFDNAGNGQIGVVEGMGLNNIGLLVRTTGLASNGSANGFTIADGSGVAMSVACPDGATYNNKYVTVTGISSIDTNGDRIIKALSVQTVN